MKISPFLFFILPLVLGLILIPFIKHFAKRWKLYDAPGGRKIHAQPIAALGGVALFIAFWLPVFFLVDAWQNTVVPELFTSSLILFLASLWDDVKPLSAKLRLVIQIVVATGCFFAGVKMVGLYGVFNSFEWPVIGQYLLTAFIFVLLINAFNLIDGINGLAGSLSLVASLCFVLLFLQQGQITWSLYALALSAAIMAFLKFNFNKASIFMGDNGSTFLGFIFSVFLIQYLNSPGTEMEIAKSVVTAFGLLAIPILDLFRVSIMRMLKGKSPFAADQTHIHHLMLQLGGTHKSACLRIVLFQGFIFLFAQVSIQFFSLTTALLAVAAFFMLGISLVQLSVNLTAIKESERKRSQIGLMYKI